MAPGAKKKNSNRKSVDNQPDEKKNVKNNFVDKPDCVSNAIVKEEDLNAEQVRSGNKKYSKRSVSSNWQKYEEVPNDPHADTLRGKDFEVLLSYSGGAGSQLLLQDEKDWEEAVDEKSIALDIKDLVHVVKSIPFHKQLNLPTSIFTEAQLDKFNVTADLWRESYKPSYHSRIIADEDRMLKKENSEIPVCLDSSFKIIENSLPEDSVEPILKPFNNQPVLLEEKTENIIESLASCLSLKASVSEKKSALKKKDKKESDDLDFLLSLTLKSPDQEEKQNEKEKTNIDDWLNSLLDD